MIHNDPTTIDERMQRVHERILAERGTQSQPREKASTWRNFVKWNDAPPAIKQQESEAR